MHLLNSSSNSDDIINLTLYRKWENGLNNYDRDYLNRRVIRISKSAVRSAIDRNKHEGRDTYLMHEFHKFVNLRILSEVHLLVTEMKKRLLRFGISKSELSKDLTIENRENQDKIKFILTAAYFSNVFRTHFIRSITATKMIRLVKEDEKMDPYKTVEFVYDFQNIKDRHQARRDLNIKGLKKWFS